MRPAMTYCSAVWHAPAELKGLPKKTVEKKLSVVQNKCLRMVSGAYKATHLQALGAETYVSLISLHPNQLQAKSRYRMQSVGQAKSIAKACKGIAGKLKSGTGRPRIAIKTPGQRKQVWAKSFTENTSASILPLPLLLKRPL